MESTWVTCPSCRLKHRGRAEGTCPRCGSAIDPVAEEVPPQAAGAGTYAATPPLDLGVEIPRTEPEEPALRLAGGALLLNAVLVLMERVLLPDLAGEHPGGMGAGFVSVFIDAGLGISLLTGNERYRGLATTRAALGMLVFTGLHLFRKDLASALMQLVLSGSLLMLLVGTPSGVRRGMAILGVSFCMLLEGVGLYSLRTGRGLFGDSLSGAQVVQGGVLKGRKFPFQMNVPGNSWRLRGEESAAKDNPLVDRWLIHPKTGTNLILIGETIPAGSKLNLDIFGKNVVANLRKAMNIVDTQPPVCETSQGLPTCLIRGTATQSMMSFDYEIRVFAAPSAAYQLIAFGPSTNFAELRNELQQAARSFVAN